MKRARALAALVCALLLVASGAMAHDGHRVVIVVEGVPTAQTMRIEERLRAELTAAGFLVVTVSRGEGADPSVVREVFRETSSQGAVVIRTSGADPSGVVWARNPVTGAELVRDVKEETETAEGVSIFAIRAAEQVRASILEMEAGKGHVPPAPEAVAPQRPPAKDRPVQPAAPKPAPVPVPEASATTWRYELTGGGAVLASAGGVPSAWGPTLSVGWRVSPRWVGEVRFVGPSLSSIEARSGHVDFDQELFVVRARAAATDDPAAVVVPAATVGLGAHRIGVRGNANAPFVSSSNQAWSGVLTVGVGAQVRISDSVALLAEAGVWWTSSRATVRVAGGDNVRTGRPGFSGLAGAALRW